MEDLFAPFKSAGDAILPPSTSQPHTKSRFTNELLRSDLNSISYQLCVVQICSRWEEKQNRFFSAAQEASFLTMLPYIEGNKKKNGRKNIFAPQIRKFRNSQRDHTHVSSLISVFFLFSDNPFSRLRISILNHPPTTRDVIFIQHLALAPSYSHLSYEIGYILFLPYERPPRS